MVKGYISTTIEVACHLGRDLSFACMSLGSGRATACVTVEEGGLSGWEGELLTPDLGRYGFQLEVN